MTLPQNIDRRLQQFVEENNFFSKGPLSVAVQIVARTIAEGHPLDPDEQIAPSGTQVKGLSGSNVKKILREHGIDRVLSSEGGRTSRGSVDNMRAVVAVTNEIFESSEVVQEDVLAWWISKVEEYFASEPIRLRVDQSQSLQSLIGDAIEKANERQKQHRGMMFVGIMLQHLVGAKLDWMLPTAGLEHHGTAVADSPSARSGDFLINDTAIHVTSAPTEALLEKCQANLDAGFRPIIVTTADGAGGGQALARNIGLENRVEIIEIAQFIATNVYEKSSFSGSRRKKTLIQLIERYNELIENFESDPSLKIQLE